MVRHVDRTIKEAEATNQRLFARDTTACLAANLHQRALVYELIHAAAVGLLVVHDVAARRVARGVASS